MFFLTGLKHLFHFLLDLIQLRLGLFILIFVILFELLNSCLMSLSCTGVETLQGRQLLGQVFNSLGLTFTLRLKTWMVIFHEWFVLSIQIKCFLVVLIKLSKFSVLLVQLFLMLNYAFMSIPKVILQFEPLIIQTLGFIVQLLILELQFVGVVL